MIREYIKITKDYLSLSQTKLKYFLGMVFTSMGYRCFLLLNTLFASWIIKYATANNLNLTYTSLGLLALQCIDYFII